jgi:prepilin-type N-terminal cleavage/methylation domain-containing protein
MSMRQSTSSGYGFTLIELSIALIIIGLLVGGVLVGRDLIAAAQLRATARQVDAYKSASQTFKLKYSCLPGDCNKAESKGLGMELGIYHTGNGDGNSLVCGNGDNDQGYEALNFWHHLMNAKLVSGQYAGYTDNGEMDYPPSKLGLEKNIGFWVGAQTDGSAELIPDTNGFWLIGQMEYYDVGNTMHVWGGINPAQQYAIDNKVDDGLPFTGSVQLSWSDQMEEMNMPWDTATYPFVYAYGPGGAASNYCAANDVTPPRYNIVNTSNNIRTLCILYFKGGF